MVTNKTNQDLEIYLKRLPLPLKIKNLKKQVQ